MLLAAGCGSGDATVSGTLTNGGKPLEVGEKGDVQIHFLQVKDGQPTGQAFATSADAEGHYEVTLPPGEYKIAVLQLDPYPNVDKLAGKFNQENTPITKTFDGSETYDIDLSKPGG